MPQVKQTWTSTGSSGGLTAIEMPDPAELLVLYIDHSTLASTNSISLQSAQNSSGPFFIEASTVISTAVSTGFALRVTGPMAPWVRPYLHAASTGIFNFTLIGVL